MPLRPAGIVLLFLILSWPMSAQGFRTFNGRNHPELDWRVAETDHFKIIYPLHLTGIEQKAAEIAEASYEALSANLKISFDKKIRLYLSDEDEIANGLATPIAGGYTTIWVHANESATTFTGSVKWLRKVIPHELVHLFHYRATRTRLGLLAYAFGNPRPQFWAEGLAQYLTEPWDAMRGERWLRMAALNDQLDYQDRKSLWNGRLLYAVGHSQVRQFVGAYGDDALPELLKHRSNVLLGLADAHRFKDAFESVTGSTYESFRNDWAESVKRHYMGLAERMEAPADLVGATVSMDGAYVADVKKRKDGGIAAMVVTSVEQPIERLYFEDPHTGARRHLAEGPMVPPFDWSPAGDRIVFTRTVRNNAGSWVNDLFAVDVATGDSEQLTINRRAAYPTFSPNGRRLAFSTSFRGTSNVYVLNLHTGEETRVTDYEDDTQITGLSWHPFGKWLAICLFDSAGRRSVRLRHVGRQEERVVSSGSVDYRRPLWSLDGRHLAVTSLEDGVPNVFTFRDVAERVPGSDSVNVRKLNRSPRRVTGLMLGASATDWIAGGGEEGFLLVKTPVDKTCDSVRQIPAGRRSSVDPAAEMTRRADWMWLRPDPEVPELVSRDSVAVSRRYGYRPARNLEHILTAAVPYYLTPRNWGIAAATGWVEPLGKHAVLAYGNLSFSEPAVHSSYFIQYVNNRNRPTLVGTLWRFPAFARVYGSGILLERFTGTSFGAYWPLDLTRKPYRTTRLGLRVQYGHIDPIWDESRFGQIDEGLEEPEEVTRLAVGVSFRARYRPPYRHNGIHPLTGHGVLARFTIGSGMLSPSADDYVRLGILTYRIFRAPGRTRLYWYNRFESEFGQSAAQNFIGLSRYDDVTLKPPFSESVIRIGESERVRGYRRYVIGRHLAFSSLEYRVPLALSVKPRLLGVAGFGRTALAAFVDAGGVWQDQLFGGVFQSQVGMGVEVKNLLRFGGLELLHAAGVAQPVTALGGGTVDLYYRIKAVYPF